MANRFLMLMLMFYVITSCKTKDVSELATNEGISDDPVVIETAPGVFATRVARLPMHSHYNCKINHVGFLPDGRLLAPPGYLSNQQHGSYVPLFVFDPVNPKLGWQIYSKYTQGLIVEGVRVLKSGAVIYFARPDVLEDYPSILWKRGQYYLANPSGTDIALGLTEDEVRSYSSLKFLGGEDRVVFKRTSKKKNSASNAEICYMNLDITLKERAFDQSCIDIAPYLSSAEYVDQSEWGGGREFDYKPFRILGVDSSRDRVLVSTESTLLPGRERILELDLNGRKGPYGIGGEKFDSIFSGSDGELGPDLNRRRSNGGILFSGHGGDPIKSPFYGIYEIVPPSSTPYSSYKTEAVTPFKDRAGGSSVSDMEVIVLSDDRMVVGRNDGSIVLSDVEKYRRNGEAKPIVLPGRFTAGQSTITSQSQRPSFFEHSGGILYFVTGNSDANPGKECFLWSIDLKNGR